MDVTPSESMFAVMRQIVDTCLAPIPGKTAIAGRRRADRNEAFDLLHRLVGLAMREGVNRAIKDALARQRGPEDAEDRKAIARAQEDAHAGALIVPDLRGRH